MKPLRTAALIALIAALIGGTGDLVMLYAPGFARDLFAAVLTIPPGRVLTGFLMGVLSIPLLPLGYWAIAEHLKPLGPRFTAPILLIGVVGAALGAAIHALVAMPLQAAISASVGPAEALPFFMPFAPYVVTIYVIFYLLMGVGSLIFILALLQPEAPLPRWLIAFSPLVTNGLATLLGFVVPPLGDVLLPSIANYSHVLLFGALLVATRSMK